MTDALVALALRYGHAVPLGLVVDGVSVSNVDRAEKLLALTAESQEIHAKLRDSDAYKLLDQLMPGHAEETERLDRAVDASMLETVKEARADLAEDLSAPIKEDVAEHWQRLGWSHAAYRRIRLSVYQSASGTPARSTTVRRSERRSAFPRGMSEPLPRPVGLLARCWVFLRHIDAGMGVGHIQNMSF